MATLQEYFDWIETRGPNATAINAADLDATTIIGARVTNERSRALGAANVDPVTGAFTGRRSTNNFGNIRDQLDHYKDFQEDLKTMKDEVGGSGRGTRTLERMSEQQKERLTRNGKNVLRDIDEGIGRHNSAIEALKIQEARIKEQLTRNYTTKLNAHQTTLAAATTDADRTAIRAEIETLRNNYITVKDKIADEFGTLTREHTTHLSEFENIVKEVETHTGLKAVEHMPNRAKAAGGILKEGEMALEKGGEIGLAEKTFMGGHWGATGIGVVGGGLLGYAVSDKSPENGNSTMMTVIGGVGGGFAGRLLSGLRNGSAHLGAAITGHGAAPLLSDINKAAGVASHIRG